MEKISKRRIFAGALALLLAISVLFGNVQQASAAQTGAGNYYLKINKGTNVVTAYKQDGTPYVAFTCSIGNATPIGTFYTMNKYRWWTLDGPSYGQYCTRITGSILFHSVWYYQPQTNQQSYVQYNKLGTTASHGCCRLTVAAAKWIYDNCPLKTKVIIFNGTSKDDPLGKPKTITVSGTRGWDPTDPDVNNPYATRATKPTITVSKTEIAYGSTFTSNMTCKDSGGFDITSWVKMSGSVNTKQVGSYPVTYSVIDSFGRTATKTVTYKVVDKNPPTLTGVKEEITKSVGTTRDMLVGLKAKDSLGTDITNQIQVYIKVPGIKGYQLCESTQYTFEKSGTYKVKYIAQNPGNGKKVTGKQTITVIDKTTPIFTSKNDWASIEMKFSGKELDWDRLMKGITAQLTGGEKLKDAVKIKVISPAGKRKNIVKGESYTFKEVGTYQLIYSVSNPNAPKATRTATAERSVIVKKAAKVDTPVDDTTDIEQPTDTDDTADVEQPTDTDAATDTEQPETGTDETTNAEQTTTDTSEATDKTTGTDTTQAETDLNA